MEMDIQNQINRWLQDDEKAFEQVFHYYYPRLYRYAFRYLKNEFWAEELSMEDLPPQRRLIFLLHRNDQLSYKEIAQKLDISPKTVENHIGAALKQLRVAMLQYLTSIIL